MLLCSANGCGLHSSYYEQRMCKTYKKHYPSIGTCMLEPDTYVDLIPCLIHAYLSVSGTGSLLIQYGGQTLVA